jgi:monovalent cation:H+ antiporter-2, CPA2 family
MTDAHLVLDLALAWSAAFVGGVAAQRLRQPPILGYLLAGMVIGPFTPGPVIHNASIPALADIGVAFLMFALGAEFSLAELRALGKVVSIGGPLQVLGTMALGPLLAAPLHLSLRQGVFLGALLALSSTVVALKVLMGRGELQSGHGRVALGLLIAQDLAVVPLVVLLPTVAAHGGFEVMPLLAMIGKAAAVIVGVFIVGTRLAPWLLRHAASTRSRELLLLGGVALALGTALLTQAIGLSLAFGAFLAGLAVAESNYRTQVLAEVLPLRDLFTSLFFVSVGLLINPATLETKLGLVLLVSAVTIVGKTTLITAIVSLLGVPIRAAVMAAVSVAQIGEFSFVLGRIGLSSGAIPASVFDLILATSLVTIVLSAPLFVVAPALGSGLERLFRRELGLPRVIGISDVSADFTDHAVICGYGRVGQEVAYVLQQEGVPYLVIEYNPAIVEELRAHDIPVIYGDAGTRLVLQHAHLETALLLAVLLPDGAAGELVTATARDLCPALDILARATNSEQAERLREAGATNVVQPEFEAGVAVAGYALRRYGRTGPELARATLDRRRVFYRRGK